MTHVECDERCDGCLIITQLEEDATLTMRLKARDFSKELLASVRPRAPTQRLDGSQGI